MKATFENTIDILVKAYLNGTLMHGDCKACAVGNICGGNSEWAALFFTSEDKHHTSFIDGVTVYGFAVGIERQEALDVIEKTGYSVRELARIEYAFETAEKPFINCLNSDDTWMFNGLMAVVEVLAAIHGIDLSKKEEAKKLFVKA